MRILHLSDVHLGMENYGRVDPSTGLAELVFRPGLSTLSRADLDAGRGMGAVAARDAIAAAGGELAVETARGQGTVFTAVLPLRR